MLHKLFLCGFGVSLVYGTTVTWNLQASYRITQEGFALAIADAQDHFTTAPNDTVIIQIDSGKYDIGGNGSHGISLGTGLMPGPAGRLIFAGAGMDQTTLVFTETPQDMIHGWNVYRTEFKDMHMTRPGYTVTQGTVVAVDSGEIILDIQEGFPTPLDLWSDWEQGRFLRRYTSSRTDPLLIQEDNKQVSYGLRDSVYVKPQWVAGNQWRIYLDDSTEFLHNYAIGELVGVKSKHEGDTYWISAGEDLVFRNIRWTGSSRGLVRTGFNNLKVIGCRIDRGAPINGQTPCLSTPSGGLQMNQYSFTGDTVSTGMVVEDFHCESAGDDCVAFFNVNGGRVINSTLRNSFARGLLLTDEAKNICVAGTEVINAPVQRGISREGSLTILSVWSMQEALDSGIVSTCTEEAQAILQRGSSKALASKLSVQPKGSVLSISADSPLKSVGLYDLRGRLVRSVTTTSNHVQLQTQGIAQGTYILRVGTHGALVVLVER